MAEQLAEKRRKPSRAEKSAMTRAALLDAATRVVGEGGYGNASIAEITREAGVALGTFYNYFENRDDLLDQLLPYLGERMLAFIHERTREAASEAEREEKGFRAFLAFLEECPEFYRILYEAETHAPAAFETHVRTTMRGFVRVLGRATTTFEERELEALSYMLMGARHYIAMRYAREGGRPAKAPDWVTGTYMRLVRHGLGF